MATVTDTAPPRRVEVSLLVVEEFRDASGTEWRPGDRASLHHYAVRQAARERPELFRMEFETQPLDMTWLDELDAQGRPSHSQKELERRFAKQEKARAEREKAARDKRERHQLEAAYAPGALRPGFHFNDE